MNWYLRQRPLRMYYGIAEVLFVLLYSAAYLIPYYFHARYGIELIQEFSRFRLMILCGYAGLYGFARITAVIQP
jgi:hypothetical protein